MGWTVTITKYEPDPAGLRLRLVIRPEGASWVKFASTVVVYDDLDEYVRGYVMRRLTGPEPVQESDVPLF